MEECVYVQSITRHYGSVTALDGISCTIHRGELLAFVGPSGAGKTTLMKIIAGIDLPDSGNVVHHSRDGVPHPAILVFQDHLLFPHMTVFDNVAFGLRSQRRRRGLTREALTRRVNQYLTRLGIADKAHAWPSQLSGGQKQRVALARALAVEPELLLLDEPFASLDPSLKRDTALFLRQLQQELGVTMLIVSHDIADTLAICDRVGVLVGGRLIQMDSVETVRHHPRTPEVAALFANALMEEEESIWV